MLATLDGPGNFSGIFNLKLLMCYQASIGSRLYFKLPLREGNPNQRSVTKLIKHPKGKLTLLGERKFELGMAAEVNSIGHSQSCRGSWRSEKVVELNQGLAELRRL